MVNPNTFNKLSQIEEDLEANGGSNDSNQNKASPSGNSSESSSTAHWRADMMSDGKFFAELKACMNDTSRLASFMDEAEHHPRHAWHKALLLFHHIQAPTSTSTFSIDPNISIVNEFIDKLIALFPDVLQRVLLRGAYREGYHERVYGALHVPIICKQPKIVELLTRVESKMHIKKCLAECTEQSHDEFKTIARALLWSNLEESTRDELHLYNMAKFMNEFDTARRSENAEQLEHLIAHANHYPKDAWRTILLWASGCGENHIVRMFKDKWPELFSHIKETSQRDGFSAIRTASLKGKEVLKGKQELYDLVGDLIDLADGPHYRELLAKNLHSRVGQGWTALHMAAILGDEAMLNVLIDCYDSHQSWGKVADRLNSYSHSPSKPKQKQHLLGPQQLLYSYNDFGDDSWMTPLHHAIVSRDVKIARKLLNWKTFEPHLNAFNLFMCTGFHMAANTPGGSAMLQVLMENPSIDVNVQDCCLFSPLHWAVYIQATDTIRFLLSRSTDAERPIKMSGEDFEGRQAFAIAVENESWKLLTGLPEVKQEVERLYRDRQVYIDAANAILVGAALIAGVTFGGWLSPPAGVPGDFHYVRVYWAFNSLSFFFSIAAVMAGAAAVLPMEDAYIGKAVKGIREWLILTSFLLIISVIFVLGAFTAAGFASLDSSVPRLKKNMLVTSCMGCLVCGAIGLSFLEKLLALMRDWGCKYFQIFMHSLTRSYRCVERGITNPLTPVGLGIELDIKEDWNVISSKWKGRELEWKRLRGIHHFGHISTSTCRRYALQSQRNAHAKLLGECQQLQKVGATMAQEYEDMGWRSWTPRDKEEFKIQMSKIIDERL